MTETVIRYIESRQREFSDGVSGTRRDARCCARDSRTNNRLVGETQSFFLPYKEEFQIGLRVAFFPRRLFASIPSRQTNRVLSMSRYNVAFITEFIFVPLRTNNRATSSLFLLLVRPPTKCLLALCSEMNNGGMHLH